MNAEKLTNPPNIVDVSSPETHYTVQCTEVRLLKSQLQPLKKKKKNQSSRFMFKLHIIARDQMAAANLDVHVIAMGSREQGLQPACELQFTMMGIFTGDEAVSGEDLADFCKFYAVTILWPYAREYTSDQLRRAGQPTSMLPVINPQAVTEMLIESGLVSVEVITGAEDSVEPDTSVK